MKSNKGVTLTSLVIYIIGFSIVMGLVAIFSGYFFENLNEITIRQNSDEAYSRFLAYVSNDINSNNLAYVSTDQDRKGLIIKFKDGVEHQYICSDEYIYYLCINKSNTLTKKITICNGVSYDGTSPFVYTNINQKIDISFKINDEIYSTSLTVKL